MGEQIKIVLPLQLDPRNEGGPYFVWSDDASGIVESAIKIWSDADYNHVMNMRDKGKVVSQGNTFSEVSIERYMKKGNRLEFWRIKNITPVEQQLLYEMMEEDLAAPWWKKLYDWIGIAGQALHMPWINGPTKYCSERAVSYLIRLKRIVVDRNIARMLDVPISMIPEHPDPGDLLAFFKAHPDDFEYVGYWHHS